MTDRTNGETVDCAGCRYWSEMVAQSVAGVLKAMCVAPTGSPRRCKYTRGSETCISWASGHDGAVDEPGTDWDRYDEHQNDVQAATGGITQTAIE